MLHKKIPHKTVHTWPLQSWLPTGPSADLRGSISKFHLLCNRNCPKNCCPCTYLPCVTLAAMKKKSNFARHCFHHSSTPPSRSLIVQCSACLAAEAAIPRSPDSRTINQEQGRRGRSDRLKVKRRVLNFPPSFSLGWDGWTDGRGNRGMGLSFQTWLFLGRTTQSLQTAQCSSDEGRRPLSVDVVVVMVGLTFLLLPRSRAITITWRRRGGGTTDMRYFRQ